MQMPRKLTADPAINVLMAAVGGGVLPQSGAGSDAHSFKPYSSSSNPQMTADIRITFKVTSELVTTLGVAKSGSISVLANAGVVTLSGILPTTADIEAAVAAAKQVNGVKSVDGSGLRAK